MQLNERERRVLRRNIGMHGEANQVIKCMEELGELTRALARVLMEAEITSAAVDNLGEEMADVEIMLAQVRMILPMAAEKEKVWTRRKLARLERMQKR